MSYILDALNKSEQERREQDNVPSLQAIHEDAGKGHTGTTAKPWRALSVAVFVVVLLVLAAFMWGRSGTDDSPPPQALVPEQNIAERSLPAANMRKVKQAALPTAQSPKPDVDSLYQQPLPETQQSTVVQAVPKVDEPVVAEPEPTVQPEVSPEQAELVQKIARETQSLAGPNDLPNSLRARVPALIYTAHVYSSDESRGFAIINGRSRYKGDLLSDSLFVEAVLEDGVILNIQGYSFKLMAMKSWAP